MSIKLFTSREFNRDTSGAKRTASSYPVFITAGGKPAHVLMTFEEYQRITMGPRSIVDMMGMHANVDFDLPKAGTLSRPVDLS